MQSRSDLPPPAPPASPAPDAPSWTTHLWRVYLLVAVLVGQYYFVSGYPSSPEASVASVVSWSAVIAGIVGLVVMGRERPVGPALVVAAIGIYLWGDVVYASLEEQHPVVPFPSTADRIYLAMYPVLIVGMAIMYWRSAASDRDEPATRGRAVARLDGITVGAAAVAALGVLWMNTYLVDDLYPTHIRLYATAYPVLDAIVLAVAARVVLDPRGVTRSLLWISAGVVALVVGNGVYNVQAEDGSFAPGGLAELGWLTFSVLLAIGVLDRTPGRVVVPATVRTAVAVVATVSIPAVQIVSGEPGDAVVSWSAFAVAGAALAGRTLLGRRPTSVSAPAAATLVAS